MSAILRLIAAGILLLLPLAGVSVEVPAEDWKRCFCYPAQIIPAAFITTEKQEKRVLI